MEYLVNAFASCANAASNACVTRCVADRKITSKAPRLRLRGLQLHHPNTPPNVMQRAGHDWRQNHTPSVSVAAVDLRLNILELVNHVGGLRRHGQSVRTFTQLAMQRHRIPRGGEFFKGRQCLALIEPHACRAGLTRDTFPMKQNLVRGTKAGVIHVGFKIVEEMKNLAVQGGEFQQADLCRPGNAHLPGPALLSPRPRSDLVAGLQSVLRRLRAKRALQNAPDEVGPRYIRVVDQFGPLDPGLGPLETEHVDRVGMSREPDRPLALGAKAKDQSVELVPGSALRAFNAFFSEPLKNIRGQLCVDRVELVLDIGKPGRTQVRR